MAEFEAEFGVLNVVAQPHPDGTYIQALEAGSGGDGVRFWGDNYAAITAPRELDDQVFGGRIVLWTKINEAEPAIDLRVLEALPIEDTGARIPKGLGFNGKIFSYFFDAQSHLLLFEVRNEFGKKLSPGRCEKIFRLLLSPDRLGAKAPDIEVTAIPEDDSLERILSIHRLDRISIHLRKPNPDEYDDDVREVLAELEEQGAKSQDVSLLRAPESDSVVLNERNEKLARVAAWNGFVDGRGHNADGEVVDGSTKMHPKIIRTLLDAGASLTAVAVRYLREIRPPQL